MQDKNWFVPMLIVGVLLFLFVNTTGSSVVKSVKADTAHAAAYVAGDITSIDRVEDSSLVPEQTTCDVCKGSKKSGDGYGKCPCGDNCQCKLPNGTVAEPVATKPYQPAYWVVMKTADSTWVCGACEQDKQNVIQVLKDKYGFVIGVDIIFEPGREPINYPTYELYDNSVSKTKPISTRNQAFGTVKEFSKFIKPLQTKYRGK